MNRRCSAWRAPTLVVGAFCATALIAAPYAAAAQGTFSKIVVNGMEIAVKGNRLAGNSNFLHERQICGLWSRELGRINAELKDRVRGTVNPRMGKFSIRSDAQMRMTSNCWFRAEISTACTESMVLRMRLPRNLFLFHLTTPTVFGGWADPRFSIDFDLEASAVVTLPKNGKGRISVGPTTVRASNLRLDSQNATGDVALAIGRVYSYFTGRDLTAALTQDRQFRFAETGRTLTSLNPAVGRIPANYRIESCVAAGNMLRLNGTDAVSRGPVVR